MKPFQSHLFVPAITSALILSSICTYAGEHTTKMGEFKQIIKLEASAITEMGHPVSINPVVWKEAKIEKFLPHGSSVKKGDKLLWIDTKALDEKIDELTKERVKQKLSLESAELELMALKVSNAESLAKAELEYKRFLEDYEYYKKVTKPQKASDSEYKVKRAVDYLSYSQEEMDQLLKMYEEDGLTEETEEIIIKRAKDSLTSSKRMLDEAEREASYEKKVVVPRNDLDWETAAAAKETAWELTQKTLPLASKMKELDVDKLQRDDENAEEMLNDLIADRKLLEFESPADGVVYFGEFQNGKWLNESARKVIVEGGLVPATMNLMTIVPRDAKLNFSTFLTEKQKHLFSPDMTGHLRLESNPWKTIPAKGKLASAHPNFDHQWLVSFSTQDALPADVKVGAKATITMVAASSEKVLSIPVSAVESEPDGSYTVRVKMAEGDPEITKVELGREAGDTVEVLSGLKDGQVILTP